MNSAASLYIARNTPIHACDARVKILLLLAYTIAIFFADTLVGVSLFAICAVVTAGVGRIPARKLTVLLIPVAFLSLFAIFFNAINADVASEGLLVGGISAVRMMSLALWCALPLPQPIWFRRFRGSWSRWRVLVSR